ncbi:cytochrome d ubiquinol oxidase subunit II [Liquorilactobacillus sucicola DSM 21376 = JCM 15457]|uniref:Cytochrome d ubiquinol oxidase, subunit II n=1 Tax=Liquorilactobacillus sucicola DSM 21376 = JCM 15457 TaxID=1423806 RepID=A0A023CZ94_9LACO|nr:cytochrome d ubiquinol oxidase subunit II [Liquorilactobacillus sucicola]KRN06570.1 cytochrome d ubiquinol oxidase, subunit II [Liquorilactobacillus sucicola DSM 21376 = JCM 15457]GAJ27177.1 cytochrome d ubiquinol oxidase subunit II [Liquorilactobacillus sucicola DSM 21376 = JCM 15457]
MSSLQLLWFILIGVLFAGFFFLEGFDFGVGMSLQTLAHNEKEKDQLVATIGPVWDGNEVWLITAGGAMFASYPFWYSALFSGYYLVLFIILIGLIVRGVSFEFRQKVAPERKNFWNWMLASGSFIVPFFFGILFISMIQGMPLDAKGNMSAGFTDYINLFSLVGGIALTLLSYLHGLNYIALKTIGPIRERAKNYAKFLYGILYVGLVAFAVLLYFRTDFFKLHLLSTLLLLIVIVILTVIANVGVIKNMELLAFSASGLTLISLVTLLFTGLFPRLMISSITTKYDLLITNASSSPYTLRVMSYIALTFLPFVLAYIAWTYYIFRKRIRHDRFTEY